MRRVVLLAASAVLLTGCATPSVQDRQAVLVHPWTARTRLSSERAAAVLVQLAPKLQDSAAASPGIDWGLVFYDAATGRPAVVADLSDTARGLEDETDGLYLIPMPPGDYEAASLYMTIAGLPHVIDIPGPTFESLTLVRDQIATLGSIDATLTPKPGQETTPITSWTQADLTLSSRFDPRLPSALAKAALSKILSAPDTISGWERGLRELADSAPVVEPELARASRP